jgi:hypothetical protein
MGQSAGPTERLAPLQKTAAVTARHGRKNDLGVAAVCARAGSEWGLRYLELSCAKPGIQGPGLGRTARPGDGGVPACKLRATQPVRQQRRS